MLPLPADGRMVGVCLVGWDAEHRFGPEERSLLTATAGLVGQALVRAHALDAGHELATMLQRSLLPRKLPELPGGIAVARYLPATAGLEVGGDWYDVIPLRDGHVAFVIGDVQGHSAGAATIMGQMRTAVRAYAVEGHPPDVVVARANRLLVGMETDLFATCGYVDLDMEEGIARIVRAGHLPPILRHPDGVAEEVAVEGGPPLGVLAEAEFPMTEAGLAPGTLLVLLTDGMVESARLPLDEGMRRVCDVVAAADPVDVGAVADELVGGVGGATTTWRCCCCATTARATGRDGVTGRCGGCPTRSCTRAASRRAPCGPGEWWTSSTKPCWSCPSWSPMPSRTRRARWGWI